ncbi:MAG TPA: BON domain-containing protein [Vicinamibacterales bacterium]|nr:BON domain-containing protein [Vicinamibacterales bacterium]
MYRRKLGSFVGALIIALAAIGCAQTDPGITTAVKGKLAADDVVKSYRIDVDTKDHVVTLNGAVDTPAARERAVQLARNTNGVRDVVDRLTVTPGVTPTTGVDDKAQGEAKEATRDTDRKVDDAQKKAGETADKVGDAAANAALTSVVKTKFLADTTVSGLNIDVDSNKGVVTLTGNVRSAAEKQRAVKIARETEGVKSVVDRLKIQK